MFLTLGSDNLTTIFTYLVDTQDIINIAKVCWLFYHTIWKSIQIIQTCHKKNIPSTWLLKFSRLHTVIPNIIVTSNDDLILLSKQLIVASLYLHGTSVFQRALDFIKEQKKYHTTRSFSFIGILDLVIKQDTIFYFGQESILLIDLITHLQTRSLSSSIFLENLPSCIHDFTYIVGVRNNIPSLDSYLQKERFAVYPYNKSSRCLENYLLFRDNFQHYFQHRCYPNLRQLDVALTYTNYEFLRKKGCFPHLDLISFSVMSRDEERALHKYLCDHHLEIPKMVIIYTHSVGKKDRINKWIIGDLQIKACNYPYVKK